MNQRQMEQQVWAHLSNHIDASSFEELVEHVLTRTSDQRLTAAEEERFGRAIWEVQRQLESKAYGR